MQGKKIFTSIMVGLMLTVLPCIGSAAPSKPETGQEWAAKYGMEWGPNYWPTKPVRGGWYYAARPFYIGLMNPNHWPVNDWVTISLFYEPLVRTDGQYKATIPWLAESWSFPDDVTCIMKLRQGVQFHDGTTFNAEGLKYQMEWIMDSQNGCWTRSWLEPIKSLEVMDEYTLKWHFKRPWGAFLGVISNAPGFIISAKALKADVALRDSKKLSRQIEREKKKQERFEKAAAGGDEKAKAKLEAAQKKLAALEEDYKKAAALAEGAQDLDSHPVGTAWYILEEANPGNYLKLKRNPNWWFGKFVGHPDMPYLDGQKISVIPDPSVRLANLRAGKLDCITVDPTQYPMIKNDRNLYVHVYPINHIETLSFNHVDGPCKDIRVRKAVSHAIDRNALIKGVLFGLGRPGISMLPSDHWAHNPDLQPVRYDPALSKKLLAEAGYKDGLTLRGSVVNVTQSQTMAEAVKAMLAKVGINWKVTIMDSAAYADVLRTRNYDLGEGGWTWIVDPDPIATGLYHPDGGFNYGRTRNEKAITLIEAGRKEVNEAKRIKIYQNLEKVLYNNYEDCWLWYPMNIAIYRKAIQGWNHPMYLKNREAQFGSHPIWLKNGKR